MQVFSRERGSVPAQSQRLLRNPCVPMVVVFAFFFSLAIFFGGASELKWRVPILISITAGRTIPAARFSITSQDSLPAGSVRSPP